MAIPSLKMLFSVVVLTGLATTVMTQSEEAEDSIFAKPTDTHDSVGLDRIKPAAVSLEEQKSPAVQLDVHTIPNEEMEHVEPEVKVANVTNIRDDNNRASDESQKVTSPETKLRSNSSSSAESPLGLLSSSHSKPLPVNRHQGEASRPALLTNTNSHSSGEVAHEHVIRYQIHQSSEEDSEEDINAPASDRVHAKVPPSTVVNSFPVRLGPNVVRIPGNSNSNTQNDMEKTSTVMKMKPIPVIRQEKVQPHVVRNSDSHQDQYYR